MEWNRRLPINPRACNPDRVPPRDQFDASGKAIPDPNQKLKDSAAQMSLEDKIARPKDFLHVRVPLHGALKGDVVWLGINDGFTADLGSYKHPNSAFFSVVPDSWPNRMNNDYHIFGAGLHLQNWHLRSCLDTAGVVVEKKQWMYTNYGQSATVCVAALIRARLNPETGEGECFYVHEPQPVYQCKETKLVEWPKGTCKPPKNAKFRTVEVEKLKEGGKEWFDARIAALKRESAQAIKL